MKSVALIVSYPTQRPSQKRIPLQQVNSCLYSRVIFNRFITSSVNGPLLFSIEESHHTKPKSIHPYFVLQTQVLGVCILLI